MTGQQNNHHTTKVGALYTELLLIVSGMGSCTRAATPQARDTQASMQAEFQKAP
jgi:hypothetical protein